MFDKIDDYKGKNLDIQSFFEFKGMVEGVANNLGDYERFYHRATQPDGEAVVRHDHVHNLYGFNMTRAASESFKELAPDKDILMFSRASDIGMPVSYTHLDVYKRQTLMRFRRTDIFR